MTGGHVILEKAIKCCEVSVNRNDSNKGLKNALAEGLEGHEEHTVVEYREGDPYYTEACKLGAVLFSSSVKSVMIFKIRKLNI